VVSAQRTSAVVFPAGQYFYVLQLYGIAGTEQQADQLVQMSTLIATRTLVGITLTPPSDVPAGADGSTPEDSATQEPCPSGVLSSFAANRGYEEVDVSVIETVFGVDLPADVGCAILSPGDSQDSSYFTIFWPNQNQDFANAVGQKLVAGGVSTYGEPIEYRKGDSDMTLWAYPAGDSLHWSTDFEGSPALVIGEGNIPDVGRFE
jgi:hypothetical protein